MPKACELLSIAGQGLVTASQRVHMENFSTQGRRHLIRTAKDVLEGTLKVNRAAEKDLFCVNINYCSLQKQCTVPVKFFIMHSCLEL